MSFFFQDIFGGAGGFPGGHPGAHGHHHGHPGHDESDEEEVDTTKFYEVLGVEKTATAEELSRAYKKKARQLHPDRHPDDRDQYLEKFQDLQKAWDFLKDPQKRKLYDKLLDESEMKTDHSKPSPNGLLSPSQWQSMAATIDTSLSLLKSVMKSNDAVRTQSYSVLKQKKTDILETSQQSQSFDTLYREYKQCINRYESMIDSSLRPNIDNYKDWDADNIIQYLAVVENGRFEKYCDSLRKSFAEQNVTSEALPDIDKSDLHKSFGINDFKDRDALCKVFQNLRQSGADIAAAPDLIPEIEGNRTGSEMHF